MEQVLDEIDLKGSFFDVIFHLSKKIGLKNIFFTGVVSDARPTRDIESVTLLDSGQALVLCNIGGLYGPNGALPNYMSTRLDEDENSWKSFLDIFQNRYYHLLYQQLLVQHKKSNAVFFSHLLTKHSTETISTRLCFSGLENFSDVRFTDFLKLLFGTQAVHFKAYQPATIPIEPRPTLGGIRLSEDCLIGGKVIVVKATCVVEIGPINEATYAIFSTNRMSMISRIAQCLPKGIACRLIFYVNEPEVKPLILGEMELGVSTYLGRRGHGFSTLAHEFSVE